MTDFARLSPEQLRRYRENVLLRLLIRTSQAETNELTARLRAADHRNMQPSYIGLLGNVDTEGTRVITIARRMGSTRQAVSQLIKVIEAAGFLERAPDPSDQRGVIVRHTPAGRALLDDALAAMADIEAGYERIIGPKRMRALKEALADIAEAADPASALADR